jgi:hypothetical protein
VIKLREARFEALNSVLTSIFGRSHADDHGIGRSAWLLMSASCSNNSSLLKVTWLDILRAEAVKLLG